MLCLAQYFRSGYDILSLTKVVLVTFMKNASPSFGKCIHIQNVIITLLLQSSFTMSFACRTRKSLMYMQNTVFMNRRTCCCVSQETRLFCEKELNLVLARVYFIQNFLKVTTGSEITFEVKRFSKEYSLLCYIFHPIHVQLQGNV